MPNYGDLPEECETCPHRNDKFRVEVFKIIDTQKAEIEKLKARMKECANDNNR